MSRYKLLLSCLLLVTLLVSLPLALPRPTHTEVSDVPAESMPLRLPPGLMLAQGEDGTRGYVRVTDLVGPQPETPEEAVALMAEREASGYTGYYINLYAADGETVIGRFYIAY